MKKSRPPAEAADDVDSCISPPFSCLPNDVVLEILNKVMDLNMLCVCKVVSKRFYAIAHQVDTICYTTPFPSIKDSSRSISYDYAMTSLKKFNRVKSVCIRCPSATQGSITVINSNNDNDGLLYKWKVKLGKNRIDSLVFFSAASIYDNNNRLLHSKYSIALSCLEEACLMLRRIAIDVPSLEKVSITYSDNRVRVFVNGLENIDELRNWVNIKYYPNRKFRCYVPLLELPVSGYVMKDVYLFLVDWKDVPDDGNYDRFMDDEIDIGHDKKEAAYHEAMMEIFNKHRGSIKRLF